MALELNHIIKLFSEKKNADDSFLLSVNMKIEDGEFVSIVGPSGSGKTTLLKTILGIISPDEGTIILNNAAINDVEIEKRNIGCVFQDLALFENMNVRENICFPMKVKHIKVSQRKKKLEHLLTICNLQGYESRSIASLSGGEKQRVAIARALAQEPAVLLLDEPMSSLDSALKTVLLHELKNIHEKTGVTMIYVTHDPAEALSLSDRIALLEEGKLVQFDVPSKVYACPATKAAATQMGTGSFFPKNTVTRIVRNVKDLSKVIDFSTTTPESQGFFRPENAVIISRASDSIMDFSPYLLFDELSVVSQDFTGERYLITFLWCSRYYLQAYSASMLKTGKSYSLSVQLSRIVFFD